MTASACPRTEGWQRCALQTTTAGRKLKSENEYEYVADEYQRLRGAVPLAH